MRISREQLWMNIAEVAAGRSTCFRGNVGALIVKDRDVVSIGYNGPPADEDHCRGNDCPLSESGGCVRSSHAEANAMARALKRRGWTNLEGCDLYCTYSPCVECSALILQHRITAFFYRHSYRMPHGLELLKAETIGLFRVTPSGILIAARTGTIIEA